MRYISIIITLLAIPAWAQQIQYAPYEALGTPPADITPEISGMAISRDHKDVAWVHNDSGDTATVYALSLTTGELLSVAKMPDIKAKDWEDMAIGPGPDKRFDYLYLADFGNNSRKKKEFQIHRTPEPVVSTNSQFKAQQAVAKFIETFTFTYPDPETAVFDAEALLVDPQSGEITIVTKDHNENQGTSYIFRSQGPHSPTKTNKLIQVGTVYFGKTIRDRVTGGDVSTDGQWVIIRTYRQARLYPRKPGQHIAEALLNPYTTIPLAPEPQGEAIAFQPITQTQTNHPPTFYTATELGPKAINPNQTMQPISKYIPLPPKETP